jgi:mannose-6-phosphate isomerase-like protein (cupin superfamily)
MAKLKPDWHGDARPFLVRSTDIKDTVLVPTARLQSGRIASKVAYGLESSMIVATRFPGYHSIPHVHDAEQLNWILEGEIYLFIEDDGFLARKGDFCRVPRNAVHWSCVQGTGPCTIVEVHTPPLIGDPGVPETAAAMMAPDEDLGGLARVRTFWPDFPRIAETERRVCDRNTAVAV